MKKATKQVLKNASSILKVAGSSLEKVVKVSVFLRDLRFFDEMNTIYSNWFKNHIPYERPSKRHCPRKLISKWISSQKLDRCILRMLIFTLFYN